MATITEEERNGFKFIKALNVCGTHALYKTFLWGTPGKLPGTKVDVYLESLKSPPSTAFYLKANRNQKRFGKQQMKTIQESKDESEFDMSLLYMIIKLGCEDVATISDVKWINKSDEMEYYITAIKDLRNDVLHGPLETDDKTLMDNTQIFNDLLTKCLQKAGDRYKKDQKEVDKEIKYVTDELNKIMKEILGNKDLLKFCSDKLKTLMLNDTQEKLREHFKKISYINPLSLICKDLQLKVKNIFVDVNLKQEHDNKHVDYRDLLLVKKTGTQHGSPAQPQIILVEGLTGSGKTTLMKLVTQQWKPGVQRNIRSLDDYELVFWLQCKDSTMVSYHDVLDRLMPDISAKFRNLLPSIIELCEVLIIIDGVDELNDASQKLVDSVLDEFKKSTNKTFIFTSRPEKVDTFKKTIPTEYDVTTVKLEGINENEVSKFIEQTHQEIAKQTGGIRKTEKLINEVMKVKYLQKYLSMPMNLTYLIYIWDQTPDKLNLMTFTQTELYYYIHQLYQSKLLERLANAPGTKIMNLRELKSRLQIILKELYLISLNILSLDTLTISEEMKDSLKSVCKNQSLSYDEIFSAFLCFEKQYPSHYKEILDYFGALHIVMKIKDQLQPSVTDSYRQCPKPNMSSNLSTTTSSIASTPTPATSTSSPPVGIRRLLEQAIKGDNLDLTKYRNVFIHVAGLLYKCQDELPETISEEVVALLHEFGMDEDQWFDLLGNIKMNPISIRVIAGFLNTEGNICIRDNRVGSYAALLPYIAPSKLHIDIKGDPDGLPRLSDLLVNLDSHCCLELKLRHHLFHANTSSTSDSILQHLENQSELVEFMGHVSSDGVTLLPPSLTSLHLAIVSDDHAHSLLPQLLSTVQSKLSLLNILSVYVSAEVSPDMLEPLPRIAKVELGLNDVNDAGLSRACDVAGKLQPPDRYETIKFARATLTETGCQDLINGLAQRGVRVRERVHVHNSLTFTDDIYTQLNNLSQTTLGCSFVRFFPVRSFVAQR